MNSKPIAEGLFVDGPSPHLVGGRHVVSGRVLFPCPEGTEAKNYERVNLASEGTLWSWTIQRFRPKSPPYAGPEAFEPFAVGYVELPGQVIVETRLTGVSFDAIRIGERYRTVIIPFTVDESRTQRMMFAFAPAEGARV